MGMVGRIQERVQSGLILATAVFTLVAGATIPLLDSNPNAGIAFEANPDHGGMVSHDHSLCTQFGNQRLAAPVAGTGVIRLPLLRIALIPPAPPALSERTAVPSLPRAPPL